MLSNPTWFDRLGGVQVFRLSGMDYVLEASLDGGITNARLGQGMALSADARVLLVSQVLGLSTFVYERFPDGGLCLAQTLPAPVVSRRNMSLSEDGRRIAVVTLDGGVQLYQRP